MNPGIGLPWKYNVGLVVVVIIQTGIVFTKIGDIKVILFSRIGCTESM